MINTAGTLATNWVMTFWLEKKRTPLPRITAEKSRVLNRSRLGAFIRRTEFFPCGRSWSKAIQMFPWGATREGNGGSDLSIEKNVDKTCADSVTEGFIHVNDVFGNAVDKHSITKCGWDVGWFRGGWGRGSIVKGIQAGIFRLLRGGNYSG